MDDGSSQSSSDLLKTVKSLTKDPNSRENAYLTVTGLTGYNADKLPRKYVVMSASDLKNRDYSRFVASHEVGHVKHENETRNVNRNDSLLATHNRNEFSKEERKKILDSKGKIRQLQKQLSAEHSFDKKVKIAEEISDNKKKLQGILDSSRVAKRDMKYQKAKKFNGTMDKAKEVINNTKGLNSHDKNPEEAYADIFAREHSGYRGKEKGVQLVKSMANRIDKEDKKMANEYLKQAKDSKPKTKKERSERRKDIVAGYALRGFTKLEGSSRQKSTNKRIKVNDELYKRLHESIQEKIDNGELLTEEAEILYDIIEEKYTTE